MSISTADASSIANSIEECNNITNFVNLNIQYEINTGVIRNDDYYVKHIRNVLIRMRTDTVLLNAIINIRKSFLDLNAFLVSIYGTTSNAFSIATGFPTVFSIIDASILQMIFWLQLQLLLQLKILV